MTDVVAAVLYCRQLDSSWRPREGEDVMLLQQRSDKIGTPFAFRWENPGGKVKRDESGNVIIGRQFQNHNPEPGPVYSGNGYTEMSNALSKASTQTPTPKPLS